MQAKRGNKFFIPAYFLPPKFKYIMTLAPAIASHQDLEGGGAYEQLSVVGRIFYIHTT